jgi:hypothetical protein
MKYLLLPALAGLLLSACSSVSVKDYQKTGAVTKPAHIYVAPFETSSTNVKLAWDKDGSKTPAFKQEVATMLADYTVQNVTKHVAPATKVVPPSGVPRTGWLVTGRFTRINSGNRGMRMIVGLGAGGSKMETEVEVFDLSSGSRKPFLRFATTGGSNAMPGLITSGGPGVGAAYSMINAAANGTTDDAARTSRMIAGGLSEYFGEHGWIPKDKVFKIKRPGDYQVVHGM